MKKAVSVLLILTFVLTILLAGCSGGGSLSDSTSEDPSSSDTTNKDATEPEPEPSDESGDIAINPVVTDDPNNFKPALPTDTKGELTLWVAWPLDSWVGMFNSVYPNVKVNLLTVDPIEEKLKTALAAGSGAPDIAFLDGGLMGNYNTVEGFEDLLQPPYDAGKYEKYFPPAVWQRFMSLDGKRLISIATDTAPAVTFYRPDIMEENGFPTDPAEFGQYISDTENFIGLAKTLKAQDKYVIQWDSEPLSIYTFGIGFFNRKLEWQRNNEKFVTGLDLAKRFRQEKLASNINFWDDEGSQAVASGKLAMVFLGNWGAEEINNKAPDTAGKWHATNLPFGAFGGWGGASLGITTQSKNKEMAWEFIRMILLNSVYANKENIQYGGTPAYLPAYELLDQFEQPNEFLGGQMTGKMYQEFITKIPESISTPLDGKAQEIWDKGIQEAIEKNIDSKTALQNIQDEVERVLAIDIQALKQQIGIE
ncbi:ABC transporter substrate-binding protein [Paenibacillus thermotolerans]|uniref:ABC transporter substrate-binding protein n=1 Tax=Paenibacillus thermotolerans TaxID=3027807 RepID=UPI0023685E0C|nr:MULTISPECIES: extracellular solute-binding protein [unclassified Paenibacillus]